MTMERTAPRDARAGLQEILRGNLMVTVPWLMACVAWILWVGDRAASTQNAHITLSLSVVFTFLGCITAPLYLRPYVRAWLRGHGHASPLPFSMAVAGEDRVFRALERRAVRALSWGFGLTVFSAAAICAGHFTRLQLSWWWLPLALVPVTLAATWVTWQHARFPRMP